MKKLICSIGEYGVVVNQKGDFLILKLAATEMFPHEAWMLPGGMLNVDDQPEFGLQREILEETNLTIGVISPIHTARWGFEAERKYAVFYLCKLSREQKIVLSSEHTEYKWVNFDAIDSISWHNQNSGIAVAKSNEILKNCL
ncbi:MAG TPA: NUDIX hydrolase [Candidatus Woesebacteria bacterium]|nr:NUDIX hydrolase [Candidatus Woesebacteria bacterium]HNS95217.1 NUDIX hydrolase [Candidatus Woesebacteria bacterium]